MPPDNPPKTLLPHPHEMQRPHRMTPLSFSLPLAGTLPAPGPDWLCHSPSEPCGRPLGLIPPALTGGSSPRGLGSPKQQFPSLSCYLLGPDSLLFSHLPQQSHWPSSFSPPPSRALGARVGAAFILAPTPPQPSFPRGASYLLYQLPALKSS